MAPSSDSSDAAARPPTQLVFGSTGLSSLQQEVQQNLMDEIDRLRSAGVNEFVSLPQLVVCGDQSSGKSSVLEAITEIPFPRRANLCTRFATQIMLRRGSVERATVRIIPFSKRSNEEKDRLKNFTGTIESFTDLPGLIDKASEVMGVGTSGSCFARDTLSIEIFGPDKPQLTIVDTPGLIHSETRGQTQADIQMVSDLVHDYMHDPRTIILAVVSARNDIANQVVLHRARTADPSGERTLGIITKPDTAGPEMEGAFVALARNEDIPLTLGWHMLRNRSTEEKEMTFAERNLTEQMFFRQRPWSALTNSDTGIEALRVRLSWLLFNHIQREIPRVRQEILEAYEKATTELGALGAGRSTPDEQRAYLIDISQKLTERCRAAVDGNYESSFFATSSQKIWKRHRLRAVVQQVNTEFAELMRTSGHFREIGGTNDPPTVDGTSSSLDPVRISKQQAVEWVRPFIEASRGRELSGSYNPLLIRDLFMEQSQRWNEIARLHVNRVWKRCQIFLKSALNGLAPADVVEGLWQCYLDEAISARLKWANEELEELLMDKSSVITYNHYYTQNVQKNRIKVLKKQLDTVAEAAGIKAFGKVAIDGTTFWASVEDVLQPNMDDFACEEALESMLAYYKVLYTLTQRVPPEVFPRVSVGLSQRHP
ncbi:dynamin family protein [Ascodesmis nigricans]|uniref:Dynamin family protein n=1 Tax=Ascodesmis nigricans TaxID=341454 RepID=A0A4S2MLH6_9PEZI|nr:dynamin family protein [Ascodesmis nigricans]